jgi:LmbE family N-acetylglucosaminyl deacetylase
MDLNPFPSEFCDTFANLTIVQSFWSLLFLFFLEFSFFLAPISSYQNLPFTIHFILSIFFSIVLFSASDFTFSTVFVAIICYIFVLFRLFALFINDTQITQMTLSSLYYPQTGTILTPLALDFLQQQASRAHELNDGKNANLKADPASLHAYNSGLNDGMISGGFNKDNGRVVGPSGDKVLHFGLATESQSPPKIPVLFVLAHPDDESMFFTPLLHAMAKHNEMVRESFPNSPGGWGQNDPKYFENFTKRFKTDHNGAFLPNKSFERVTPAYYDVHILCLSTGNAAGLGEIRKNELFNSCIKVHNIPRENIEIINDEIRLPDSMTSSWDQRTIQNHIEEYINRKGLSKIDFTPAKEFKSDFLQQNGGKNEQNNLALHHMNFHDLILITFDEFGVSSHKNHIACFEAAKAYTNRYNTRLLVEQGNLQNQADLRDELVESDDDNDNTKKNGKNNQIKKNNYFDPNYENNASDDDDDDSNHDNSNEDQQTDYVMRKRRNNNNQLEPYSEIKNINKVHKPTKKLLKKHLAYRTNQFPITNRYMTMYGVETVPFWSKYIGPLGALMLISNQLIAAQKPTEINNLMLQSKVLIPNTLSIVSWTAMAEHYSQWVWFRKLFVLFSVYSYLTPLNIIVASPIHPSLKQIGRTIQSGLSMD